MQRPDPEWLTRESERWEADGVISSEQRREILSRYPEGADQALPEGAAKALDAQQSSRALVWLAWLVAGFGLIFLVAWNWATIPGTLKIAGTVLVALGLYAGSWRAAGLGREQQSEWLAFGAALAVGAVTAACVEVFDLQLEDGLPLLLWALAIAVTAVAAASPITTTLGACVLTFWAMVETGQPPAPWLFLLGFPLLALAIERRPNEYAAGVVTLALGTWVTLVGLDTWRSASVPGVMLIAAGAAIDHWAHGGSGRRPAFARTTPALALVVMGLWFLGMAGLNHTSLPQLAVEPDVLWPGLALLASLVVVAMWPSEAQRAAGWRPAIFGGLVVAWAVSVLAAGPAPIGVEYPPAPEWWSWLWTITSSLALVMLTVSAVREGVDTNNRALLVVGVAAMVALVIMHFANDNADFGRSALVLFFAAGVLWWVSRALRHKPDPKSPVI